ncbi:hypothetical protein AB1Y20_003961 [Prymnesium parvum]|uniref:Large ribosomal subunit protein uL29m n=1 Tax=Prymnesium parvum TaxID=97485 RepID=A0AB34J661_PRYPA
MLRLGWTRAAPRLSPCVQCVRQRLLHATTPSLVEKRPLKPLEGLEPAQYTLGYKPSHLALLEFVDPYENGPQEHEPGRQWKVEEIRLKSNSDLQKLWIVLLKERNMLHTTRHLHRKRKTKMPFPERVKMVRKSMGLIKRVLKERSKYELQRQKLIRHFQHNTPKFNVPNLEAIGEGDEPEKELAPT